MARYRGPKQKIARKYREPLFGHSKALDRKNYAPGQHGKNKRKKSSNYGIQLAEKQKAKAIYGVLEKQFENMFVKASKKKGVTGTILLQMLESRLDNVVYRMGFAPTRRAARQLVLHRHVLVNGEPVNIPSFHVKAGDVIEIRERSKSLEIVANTLSSRNTRYNWLEVDKPTRTGKYLHDPEREDIPEKINEQLIVELYSK